MNYITSGKYRKTEVSVLLSSLVPILLTFTSVYDQETQLTGVALGEKGWAGGGSRSQAVEVSSVISSQYFSVSITSSDPFPASDGQIRGTLGSLLLPPDT